MKWIGQQTYDTAVGDITGITAGTGLDGGGTTGNIDLSVDVSDFMTNGVNNRVLTATGTDAMNAEANLTFNGSALNVTGVMDISPANDAGAPALTIDNDDVDQAALVIYGANTTQHLAFLDGRFLTTHDVINIDCHSLTTGSVIMADIADTLTGEAGQLRSLIDIDYNKAGVTSNLVTSSTTGLNINLADTATNHAGSLVTMIGAQIDVDSADARGTLTQKGLILNVAADGVGDGETTSGIEMEVMDGGTDIKMMSSADTGDYCTIATTTNGATTITTVDNSGSKGADFEIATAGDIILDAAGQIKLEPVAGNNILLDGTVTVDGGSVTGITTLGVDSVSLTAVQTSAETFVDNDTSIMTSAAIDDRIRVASKHVLRCNSFYVSVNPLAQNSLYFGNSVGNTPWNWNDGAAVGGVIGDTSSFTIIGDDENWGIVLPMDISKIEVQCSLRPSLGQGDDFTIAIYTGVRSSDSATALTLTKIDHESVSFSATNQNYTRNDIDVTTDLDKGTMIYVGVGSEDSTDAKQARGYMNITVTER